MRDSPADLVGALRQVKQYLTFAGGTPFQEAVATGLRESGLWFDTLRADLQQRRDGLTMGLRAAGFHVHPTEGTYFVQAGVRPLGYGDGVRLCRELPGLAGVVAVPSSAFFDDPEPGRSLVRFAFCKDEAVLAQAVTRLSSLRDSLHVDRS